MKPRSLTQLSLVLVLSGLSCVVGCTQSSAVNAEPVLTNVPPASATSPIDSGAAVPEETSGPTATTPRAEPILPPNILPTSALAEVVKLAQAGVDESVMLTYITNSVRPFELDAEAIVYLNDLGMSGSLITSMMQHDQGLKSKPSSFAAPAVPESEPVAAAPTYVNPPPAPSQEAQPTYVSNNYFYDSLAPYGSWVEVQGYGRCWRPTVVIANRNWQPYCDRGRWVYTDAGWYWLSDYSWGATTFHYGRWFAHPSWGWCWWPDTIWAPSWVNWRYSGGYCGWAPLPPAAHYRPGIGFSYYGSSVGLSFGFGLGVGAYTFVPWGSLCAARPYQHRVSIHEAGQVFNNSTVVNNYGGGNGHPVINRGISPERFREHTRTELRPVKIRDEVTSGPRNERLERDGHTIVVHRPQMTAPAGSGQNRPEASNRSNVRLSTPRAGQSTESGSFQNPVKNPGVRNSGLEGGVERSRPAGRVVVPATPSPSRGVAPATVTTSPVGSPTRIESRPSREPQVRSAEDPNNRGRSGAPAATRPSESSVPNNPAPGANPRPSPPRSYQLIPQDSPRPTSAAPAGSLIVIGGKNTARTEGRDYSVWSTPTPSPTIGIHGRAPDLAVTSPSGAGTVRNLSAPDATPPVSRGPAERPVTSRPPESTFAAPGASTPSSSPRSRLVSPEPTFTARPDSANPPANSPRYESRSAPSGSTGGSRSQSRPDSARESRSR